MLVRAVREFIVDAAGVESVRTTCEERERERRLLAAASKTWAWCCIKGDAKAALALRKMSMGLVVTKVGLSSSSTVCASRCSSVKPSAKGVPGLLVSSCSKHMLSPAAVAMIESVQACSLAVSRCWGCAGMICNS